MSEGSEIRRFGLALSGGGFRAVLYHLGVIRFLRDANLLRQVTHITSVSGGSVIGAHLALNWDRYSGTDEAFQQASSELLRFLQMDVRNRIVRRFPLAASVNAARRLFRMQSKRQYTRAGLLEHHYEKFLYGDAALFNLPNVPQLYILATNLSEGSLCAFHREGLLLQRRSRGAKQMHFEDIEIGLATVPMAVAASSAFPGFFPPLELQGVDVGAKDGEFLRHAFTDGGIYDNIGLRMFHHLEQMGVGKELDGVLVSDAGATFKVRSDTRAGGLFSTALRSSDILMDRVNQMERESFVDAPGVLFFPITQLVQQTEDPTAPHLEIQRQAALIRTDMDRFSDLEMSVLVQHGYCVARRACRAKKLIPSDRVPTNPPWSSLISHESSGAKGIHLSDSDEALAWARKLQSSAVRRVIRTLFSFHDWPSYIWILLIAAMICAVPYEIYTSRRTAARQRHVLSAVAATSPVYRDVLHLLHDGPVKSVQEISYDEVESVEPLDFLGYDVISDDRIYDFRGWTADGSNQPGPLMHARFRMRRTEEARDRPHLRIQLPSNESTMRVEFQPKTLRPKHVRAEHDGVYVFETSLDFSQVPIGTDTNLTVRQIMPSNIANQDFGVGRFKFLIGANTGLARIWVLLPEGRDHDQFVLNRFPLDRPDDIELVKATTTVELPFGSIATFELVNPKSEYRYECRWRWLDHADEE